MTTLPISADCVTSTPVIDYFCDSGFLCCSGKRKHATKAKSSCGHMWSRNASVATYNLLGLIGRKTNPLTCSVM